MGISALFGDELAFLCKKAIHPQKDKEKILQKFAQKRPSLEDIIAIANVLDNYFYAIECFCNDFGVDMDCLFEKYPGWLVFMEKKNNLLLSYLLLDFSDERKKEGLYEEFDELKEQLPEAWFPPLMLLRSVDGQNFYSEIPTIISVDVLKNKMVGYLSFIGDNAFVSFHGTNYPCIGKLEQMVVDEEYRKKGIGENMLEIFEEIIPPLALEDLNVPYAIQTTSLNANSINLFSKKGYMLFRPPWAFIPEQQEPIENFESIKLFSQYEIL